MRRNVNNLEELVNSQSGNKDLSPKTGIRFCQQLDFRSKFFR